MADETVEVLELTLTKLDPEGAEAKLTLADEKLVVDTADDSPVPEWLRGELAFDDIEIGYTDPAAELEEDEEPDEKPLPPGLRIAVWIDMPAAEGDETFPRKATIAVDSAHFDAEQAEAFAATFTKLAGREEPEVEEEPEVAEEAPTGAPEADDAPAEEPVAEEPVAEEAPADSAFAAADDDDKPADSAFAAPEE